MAENQAQHTPGPWRVVATCRNTRVVFPPGEVAVARCHANGRSEDILNANARLIAAAPDLLAACQLAEAYCESQGMTDGMGTPSDEIKLVCALRAAVLKATTP